jgi:hypothetical protein
MPNVDSLRRQAEHAHHLALGITDPDVVDQLERFAYELRKEAEKIEKAPQTEDPQRNCPSSRPADKR